MRNADLAADRGEVDDPAMPLGAHDRQRGQGHADHAQGHRVQGALAGAGLRVLYRADLDDPGVVHQDVKPGVMLAGRVQEQLRRVLIADVTRGRHYLGTRGPQPAGRLVMLSPVPGRDDQPAGPPGELAGRQQAQAARGTGDQGHFAADVVGRPPGPRPGLPGGRGAGRHVHSHPDPVILGGLPERDHSMAWPSPIGVIPVAARKRPPETCWVLASWRRE
jgi:hypothetical protein